MVTVRPSARLARRVVTVVLFVAGARSLLGVWLSSVVLAAVGLSWSLRAWCRLEQRLDARERALALAPEVVYPRWGPRTVPAARHVAFARALGVVAAAYMSECEQEARTR